MKTITFYHSNATILIQAVRTTTLVLLVTIFCFSFQQHDPFSTKSCVEAIETVQQRPTDYRIERHNSKVRANAATSDAKSWNLNYGRAAAF